MLLFSESVPVAVNPCKNMVLWTEYSIWSDQSKLEITITLYDFAIHFCIYFLCSCITLLIHCQVCNQPILFLQLLLPSQIPSHYTSAFDFCLLIEEISPHFCLISSCKLYNLNSYSLNFTLLGRVGSTSTIARSVEPFLKHNRFN